MIVVFRFAEEIEPAEVDLAGSLERFVKEYYPEANPFTFDMNETKYDHNAGDSPGPNGIPDMAELHLLEVLLDRADHYPRDYLGSEPPTRDEALSVWNTNLAVARDLLGNLADDEPDILYVLAGYATVTNGVDRRVAAHMLREKKGIAIRMTHFDGGIYTHFDPGSAFHERATFNRDIWKKLSYGREITREVIDAYADTIFPPSE
jgi:hypothetical protein